MSIKKKTLLSYIFIYLTFMLLTTDIQCIKFGRKDTDKVQQPEHDKEKQAAAKINDKKVDEGKTNDGGQIDQNKVKSSEEKDSGKIKQEKTPDNKKTQQTPQKTTSKGQLQQKPKLQKSWFHSVDGLFGGDDSPAKSKSQDKPLTITPEAKESQPSTIPQSHPTEQQAQPKQSILGGLFGIKIQKNAQPIKKQQQKVQDHIKENPTTGIQLQKKDEKTIQNTKEQIKVKTDPVKQIKEKTEVKKLQETKKQSQSKQNQPKVQNKDKDVEEQESQDDDVIYPKNSKPQKKVAAQPHKEGQFKYTFTVVLTFVLYTFIIVMVIVTIKCTTKSSKAAKAVNIMVDAVGDVFKKRQGYRPTLNEEQITQRQEQITVGYKVDDNKQIFWQKNSVEGI